MKQVLAKDFSKLLDVQRFALERGDLEPIFHTIGREVRLAYANTFAIAASYHDGPWPPRKLEGDGHPLLIDTGDLYRGVTTLGAAGHVASYNGRWMEEGVDGNVIEYAAAQNFGYGNLPARRFIDLAESDLDRYASLLSTYVITTMDL